MEADPREGADFREIRLEGWRIVAVAVVEILLLGAAFWGGRAYERASAPAGAAVALSDPLKHVLLESPEAADDLSFFDTLSGDGKVAEPAREVVRKPGAPPATAPASSGPFLVQVFAGRDRRAAEDLVASLRGLGYPVRVEGEKEGRGTLIRVRVGGYATRGEAQAVAERLAREGHAGAWVTSKD